MDRQEILEAYRDLRVADVCDAMDMVGLMNRGLFPREIRPLFRDTERFTHRFRGLAKTVRYVPTNREVPNLPPEQFKQYIKDWRRNISPGFGRIEPGDAIVMDAAEQDVGFIGSGNSLSWRAQGAVGAVTNGGARDTDELIRQGWPVYCRYISRTFKPGRLELDAADVPINCGGVLVRPGDVIVADGDGVICVPKEKALEVARLARIELEEDRQGRLKGYRMLGLAPDATVGGTSEA